MSRRKEFTLEEARRIGETIGANWAEISLEQFRQGLAVELEHGSRDRKLMSPTMTKSSRVRSL
jgi:hypothetical protein